jgi:hypothetical protein
MRFAMLSASGFPHEHWDAQGIRAAFTPIGSVCCIDPSFILEKDFSAVRVIVKMAGEMAFPATLLVQDAFGECTTEVEVRLVRAWTGEEDALDPASLHFDTDGAGGSPAREQPRLSDTDEGSLIGTPLTPPPAPQAPAAPVLDLWARIIARRQANRANAANLDGADGHPADSSCPLLWEQAAPSEVWDRLLAKRLASQFPDAGLSVEQVRAAASPLAPFPPAVLV